MNIHAQRILILDFGSQYSQLIARRVRELNVYCELHSCDMDSDAIKKFDPTGIILSGGPETVTAETTPRAPQIVFELGCPVFGICYGLQTMTAQLGGEIAACKNREFGYAQVKLAGHSSLLEGIEDHVDEDGASLLDVWMSHGDHVVKAPQGFKVIASTNSTPITAIADESRHFYGVQFHPEVTHTRQGQRILERFVRDICKCESVWSSQHILEESLVEIKNKVGSDQVLLGLSGGIDSTVVAALLHKAIGDQLHCIFVDHGFLRQEDSDRIDQVLTNHMRITITRVDASARFFKALEGISDPEQKRKICGNLFVEVFDEEAEKLSNIQWLAQGTIYPDVIESAGVGKGKAHTIKTHHNVGGLPENMKLKLLEPLRELFKDEVRKLGLELGLPYDLLHQHPFPGPGLMVRVLGEVTPEYIHVVRQADAIFLEELRKNNLYHQVNQAFAVFLPIKSVGVVGDARQYAHVISLRAVESTDFMTAHAARLPAEFLEKVSNRICNEVHGVSRVVYDVTSKPPATIEWE